MQTTLRKKCIRGPFVTTAIFLFAAGKIRTLIIASLLVGLLVTLASAPVQAAGPSGQPADTFVILLSGPYTSVPVKPVMDCPNLGLSQVNICDGSFSVTKIFPVSGLPVGANGQASGGEGPTSGERQAVNPIGNFYVQFVGNFAAYDLPAGAMTMLFTGQNLTNVPDGQGGTYSVGTFQLDITEATGIYASFLGGHNNMVDILHQLPDGSFVEHCYCVISRPVSTALSRLRLCSDTATMGTMIVFALSLPYPVEGMAHYV